jgi:hypothetical protein
VHEILSTVCSRYRHPFGAVWSHRVGSGRIDDAGLSAVRTWCALPKAIALGLDATGATVTDDNTLGPGYDRLVDFDHDSARTGYSGPPS